MILNLVNKYGVVPKTSFDELVKMMLDNDIELAKSEKNIFISN